MWKSPELDKVVGELSYVDLDALLAAIGEVSDQPIRFVINTHYHGDHVGGNEAVGKGGAVIIAHDNIRKRMSSDQFNHFWNSTTPAWPEGALPVVTFNDRVTLHLNGESVATVPLSSMVRASEIADTLKAWIQEGTFTLGEPQFTLPV